MSLVVESRDISAEGGAFESELTTGLRKNTRSCAAAVPVPRAMSQLTVFLLVLLQACLVFAKDNTWKVPVGALVQRLPLMAYACRRHLPRRHRRHYHRHPLLRYVAIDEQEQEMNDGNAFLFKVAIALGEQEHLVAPARPALAYVSSKQLQAGRYRRAADQGCEQRPEQLIEGRLSRVPQTHV